MFRFQQGMTDFCGGMLANVDFSRGSQITVGEGGAGLCGPCEDHGEGCILPWGLTVNSTIALIERPGGAEFILCVYYVD